MSKFKTITQTFVLIMLTSILGCNDSGSPVGDHDYSVSVEALPDLSVFNLPAQWTSQDKQEIQLADLRGKVMVITMIYTSCPFACPRLVADMKAIEQQIPKQYYSDLNMVLVSMDPEHDRPDTLRQFAGEHELDLNHWTLLTGNPNDVLEFAAVLGVRYKKTTPTDFSHSNIISVFDRQGVLVHQQEGIGVDNKATVQKITALLKN